MNLWMDSFCWRIWLMAIIIVVGSDNMYGQTVNTDDIEDIDLSATVSNTVPQVNLSNQIPDITLTLGQLPYTRTLGAAPLIFKDQEEDILQYSVSSSEPATLQAYIIYYSLSLWLLGGRPLRSVLGMDILVLILKLDPLQASGSLPTPKDRYRYYR